MLRHGSLGNLRSTARLFLGRLANILHNRVTIFTIGIVSLFLVVFLVRFLTIYPRAGPPSEDLGGDLIVAHTYTESNPIFPHYRNAAPPLYYLLVVIPMITLFQPMLALKIVDSLLPSIIIFPFYFLAREIVRNRSASLVGAYLFAFSEAFNEMMSWGGTLNLFAIFFALIGMFYISRVARQPNSREVILAALFISLTVGTHQLTALFVGLYLAVVGVIRLVRYRTMPYKQYALLAGLTVVFSLPYFPTYLSLARGSVNIVSTSSLPINEAILTLLAVNAVTPYAQDLLLAVILGSVLAVVWATYPRRIVLVVLSSGLASLLLIPFLNATIYSRVAFFLPIPIFLLASVLLARLITTLRSSKTRFKMLALFALAIIIGGLTFSDVNRLQSSTTYNQVLNDQTLQALNWIGSHTSRNQTVFTNYSEMGAWLAGYSERTTLSPRPIGYIVTAPDYVLTVAANAIDSGNYVLDGQSLILADLFPAHIYNPSIYVNTNFGKEGVFHFDDNYQTITVTNSSGIQSSSLNSSNAKNFTRYGQTGLSFNYSLPIASVNRIVELKYPGIIHVHYQVYAKNADSVSLFCRIIGFDGESVQPTTTSSNVALLTATLTDGRQVASSITTSSTGSLNVTFSPDDNLTQLSTLSLQGTSPSKVLDMDISISLAGFAISQPVLYYDASQLLTTYSVSYLVLDTSIQSQVIRFQSDSSRFVEAFRNSKVIIMHRIV